MIRRRLNVSHSRSTVGWLLWLAHATRGVAPAVLMLGASVALTIGMSMYVTAKLQGDAVVKSITQEAKILKRIHINEAARLYARQSIRTVVNQAVADVLRYGGFTDPAFTALGTVTISQSKVVLLEKCEQQGGGEVTWKKACEQELDPFLEGDVTVITARARESIGQLVPERIGAAVAAHNREDQDAMIRLTSPDIYMDFNDDAMSVIVPLNITTYLTNKLGVVSSPDYVSETVQVRMMKLFEIGLEVSRLDLHERTQEALCGVCDRYPDRRPMAKDLRTIMDEALDKIEEEYAEEYADDGIAISISLVDGTLFHILPKKPFDKAVEDGVKVVDWKEPEADDAPVPWQLYMNGEVAEDPASGKKSGRYALGADLAIHVRAEDRRTYLPYLVQRGTKIDYEYRPIAVEFVLKKRVWEGDDSKCSLTAECEG